MDDTLDQQEDDEEDGVDRSQIRYLLTLSPIERLRALECLLGSILRLRDGIRPTQVPRDPP